jgi:uncharacterized protein (DUF1800 family)
MADGGPTPPPVVQADIQPPAEPEPKKGKLAKMMEAANEYRSVAAIGQLEQAKLVRAVESNRQLQEVLVDFWSNHFNIDVKKGPDRVLKVIDDRDVIRPHIWGKFRDLLEASAKSPAMLYYLDNASNTAARDVGPMGQQMMAMIQQKITGEAPPVEDVAKPDAPPKPKKMGGINENYAREIMELHTLGVDGGYTQTDVAELSRVLTGWTETGRGVFSFNPAIHDTGTKTVLGVTIQGQTGAAGINEGEQMLDFLANHPSTARFIATKMLKWLLDPNPSELQISTVATVYKATGGDIKSMIRAILNDSWLPVAPMKFARPFHFVAASLRSTNPTVSSLTTTNAQLNSLGQGLFTWDTPDGFPDKVEYWAGNIVPRWGYGTFLSNLNSAATLVVDTTPYRAGSGAAAVDLLDQNFFGGEMPLVTRNALLAYVGTAALTDAKAREAIALAISANAFQWY